MKFFNNFGNKCHLGLELNEEPFGSLFKKINHYNLQNIRDMKNPSLQNIFVKCIFPLILYWKHYAFWLKYWIDPDRLILLKDMLWISDDYLWNLNYQDITVEVRIVELCCIWLWDWMMRVQIPKGDSLPSRLRSHFDNKLQTLPRWEVRSSSSELDLV